MSPAKVSPPLTRSPNDRAAIPKRDSATNAIALLLTRSPRSRYPKIKMKMGWVSTRTVALAMVVVVFAASVIPARRAAAVDPVDALRHD